MSIIIQIDPELAIAAEALATLWNDDADARSIGSAAVVEEPPVKMIGDPISLILVTAVISGTVGVGFGAVSHVIHKLLDRIMEDDEKTVSVPKNATVQRIDQPDGSVIVVITAPPKS